MTRQFSFLNFRPSRKLAIYAETVLLGMADFIHNGFISRAEVARSQKRFKCVLQLGAGDTIFNVPVVANTPQEAIEQAGRKIKESILEWRCNQLSLDEKSFWQFKELKY